MINYYFVVGKQDKRARGVALFGVLLLLVTLSMLVGSVVMVHHNHWQLSRGQDQRIAAHEACLSAIEFARDRLRAEPTWGTHSFGSATIRLDIPGRARATEQGSILTFELPSSDCTAELQVTNNLDGSAPLPPPASCVRAIQVPPGAALLVAVGSSGSQRRRVEVMLHRQPPLDGALFSGADTAFIPSAGGANPRVEFDGDDATKNKLRARGRIYLPTIARFVSRGAASAREDINVGANLSVDPTTGAISDSGTGVSLTREPHRQGSLETDLNASLNVGPVPPGRLESDDLQTAAGNVHPLPGGTYTFIGSGRVRYEPGGGGAAVVYQDAIYDGGADSGTPDQLAVGLVGRKFMLQGNVEASGSLRLDSLGSTSQAELALGYKPLEGGAGEASQASSLRVRGDLHVRGHLVGQGTVAALKPTPSSTEGNVVVSGRSTLASGSSTGLALFSEGDIRFHPPERTGDITLAADFEALSLALTDATLSNPTLQARLDQYEAMPDPVTVGEVDREEFVGGDETRLPGNATATVRDSRISTSDYIDKVQPLIPNWPTSTPAGNPLPPDALAFVQDCLAPGASGLFEGGMTVGRHARLMAYLRSVDEGQAEPGWLVQVNAFDTANPHHKYNELVQGVLKNHLLRVVQDARLADVDPSTWITQARTERHYSNRKPPDIDWRGLIYAKGKLWGEGNERIDIVGAVGAETGSLIFTNFLSSRLKFHDSELNTVFRQSSLRLDALSCYVD